VGLVLDGLGRGLGREVLVDGRLVDGRFLGQL